MIALSIAFGVFGILLLIGEDGERSKEALGLFLGGVVPACLSQA